MSKATFALIVALSAGATAFAQPSPDHPSDHLSPKFLACFRRAGDNPVQRSICAQREAGAQDDRLNKAYQQVMKQLVQDPIAKTTLRDEERRWIRERDYTCKVNGNTIDEACVVMKTAARADDLESRIHF
jgi:uncharacterized protein YecT (DUF1311 family)